MRAAPAKREGLRFRDKPAARQAVWDALSREGVARFPFPPHGRIPNFEGAERAAERLLAHPLFGSARVIKVNPDSPQRWVRKLALERGITVITPTPRLKGAFRKLDPGTIPRRHYEEAATPSCASSATRACRWRPRCIRCRSWRNFPSSRMICRSRSSPPRIGSSR